MEHEDKVELMPRKPPPPPVAEVDRDDYYHHFSEDVYVKEMHPTRRSTRVVVHPPTDDRGPVLEVISTNHEAVRETKAALTSGKFRVRGGELDALPPADFARAMGPGGLQSFFELRRLLPGKRGRKKSKR